jgi:signal transduction histidine kinase
MREAEKIQKELEHSLRMANDAAEAANRAVQAANEALELRVEERTRELRETQDELIKKERLSVLGQLTATVAHELRNPISAIRNTAYTIRETIGPVEPRLERPLARLDRSILRCESLVSDLLHFTRPKEPKRIPVLIDTWLGNVLDEHKIPDAIPLERRLQAPGVRVALDAEQFERVIINLVDNAVQAIIGNECNPEPGHVVVTTTLLSDEVELLIRDSGSGIPADVLPRVFEPLFTTKSFGTGLGLPTVKQIVERHRGTIGIESVFGRGTTIRITLAQCLVEKEVA